MLTIVLRRFQYMMLVILLLYTTGATAQQSNYPMMVNVQLNPPYSLYLSDYAAPDMLRMQVHLLLKDLTESNYKVRLRLKIEGPGITLMSKTGFYTPPIIVNGGEMITISGPELATYFNPQNLILQGLDNSAITKDGAKLPEGIYKFTVEVLDYIRNNVISNPGSAIVASFLSYPPIINLPLADTKVEAMEPQNVVFQWMPRHTASINAAFNVVYKFRLVELVPVNRDPNDAMRSLKPIYEEIVPQTVFVYGPGQPALTPGNNYAVQVQAVDADGKDMFVNDGYSEVVRFTYGEKCSVPQQIMAAFAGKNELKLTWSPDIKQQGFTVRYREAGDKPSQWYEDKCFLPQFTITGLKPGKKYEYQVSGQCIWGDGDYSPVASFNMPNETMTDGDFVCGKTPANAKIANTKGIDVLKVQDTIYAGDFKVIISSVEGGKGTFSGTGEVQVPMLEFMDLPVTFKSISVNTDKRMYAGVIDIAQASYAEVTKDLSNTMDSYLKNLDSILANPTPDNLMKIDAAAQISNIDKLKGWDELDANTIAQLDDIRAKLVELKDYQAKYPDMSPQEKESVGTRIGNDLKKLTDNAKKALEMAKEQLKELLGIFKTAVKALWEDKQQQAKTEDDNYAAAKAAVTKMIADNNNELKKGTGGDIPVLRQIEEVVLQGSDANTPDPVMKYQGLLKGVNTRTILKILVDNGDDAADKKITDQLKVENMSYGDYLSKQKKDNRAETETVDGVKQAITNWIKNILEKL